MSRATRLRALLQLACVSLLVTAAACLGGRGRPKVAVPPVAQRQADSARRDSIAADTTARPAARRDTGVSAVARAVDSAAASRLADSVASAAKKAPAKAPAKKKAATKECLLNTNDSPPESRFTYQQQSDSSITLMVGGGFVGRCEGEKNMVRADSAEYFELNGFVNLFGNVTYEEGKEFRVTANHATYFTREGKLYADGNVVATQVKTGSQFRGPNIEYFRVMPNLRTVSRFYAPNSPTVQIVQKDSAGKPLPPVTINASVMEGAGDSVLFAWGSVTILRNDITGRSDTASFDKTSGKARLIRGAQIASVAKDQQFTLSGDTIDLFTTDSVLDRVVATHLSRARSGDVTMSAERIDMRLVDKKVVRAFVFGPGRAKADMPQQSLEADSMDIHLPGQRIQELRAHGRAMALGKPDSTKIRSDERDELRGDTVIAVFDTMRSPKDTAAKPVIRQVTAGGNASSKVQIANRQGPAFPPAINYVRGKHLVVQFDSGQVRTIQVDSSASGNYFEPIADTLSDSTKKKPVKKPPGGPRPAPRNDPGHDSAIAAPSAFRRPE